MNRRPPLGRPAASAGSRTTSPAAVSRPARRLIGVMLIAAAALDLTRCGLVMVAVRQPAPAAGLVVAGLASARGPHAQQVLPPRHRRRQR